MEQFFITILSPFKAIVLKDIFQIFILYIVFYYLLILLKETRTMQMLKGLALLLGVSLLASIFQWHTINYFLKNIWPIWIIAFTILFQPELRQILVDIGNRRIQFKTILRTEDAIYDEIVNTVKQMLRKRTGCLIVIERNTGLKEVIETGSKINSDINAALLMTIFTPKTPLHDGAVIINHGKIIAAGCILPLTQKTDIDIELGTRHRAALGITEETDAVAIVVSEDLRNVSLSVNGKITPVEPDNLKEMLKLYASKTN
ncbi:MAG: TIGR00159 family protein [Candidatus Firestonebacteria bacterium GWA2_43_8]|nr:MAG: TIGR00159 family protein [Candidatus Firestonebacteria bacterium GWA2_43_8]